MSNYIEFTTNHSERTYGNPVHNGKQPERFHDAQGIRVDGEPIEFVDATIPLRVQRYLVESGKRHRKINDCVAFIAIMNSIESNGQNPFRNFDTDHPIRSTEEQQTNNDPLVLARGFHDAVFPRHIVLPAHLLLSPRYLHKLGDDGPLCLSNLQDAMKIFDCTGAYPARPSQE